MSAKLSVFIHALLGTLAVFAAVQAEDAARRDKLPDAAATAATYIAVFAILLALDSSLEYFQKRRQRRLRAAGFIDGFWVERSKNGDMGSFIEIRYAENGFSIEGQVFDRAGSRLRRFDGRGTPDLEGKELTYSYKGSYRGKNDIGSGTFRFRETHEGRATEYEGSFYGASSELLRNVEGKRVERLPGAADPDERQEQKKRRVLQYLSEIQTDATGTIGAHA